MAEADETGAGQLELVPERVKELLDAGEATLVDVREGLEWQAGRVPGALHIEMTELTSRAEEVPKQRTAVFYCRTGNRSAMAAEAFSQAGWDAHNMAGGLAAWVERGFEIEPSGGEVLDRRGRPPA